MTKIGGIDLKKQSDAIDEIEIKFTEDKEIWNNVINSIIEYLVENTYTEKLD